MLVRINYEKCTVVLRNNRLVTLADSRISSTTAQVYEAGLRLIESKIPDAAWTQKSTMSKIFPMAPHLPLWSLQLP
jgi:hypothetical protein